VVTKTISRRYRKKLETRARILETAVDIFSTRGIENATVEEIAHAADVGKGTIYNYFPAKEDIVIAFLVEFERKVQVEAAQIVHRGRTLESVLTAFVRFQFKLKEPHHAFVRVFLTQMFARTSAFLPWMHQLQIVIDPTLQQLFSRLRERRLLRADLDVPTLIEVFKVMQLGLTSLWAIEGPPWLGTHRLLKEQIRMFCQGIEAKSR
jgi:AcrR family transcriptional regulator